ncbi:MAG: hypothetical protein QM640_01145 [Niabella sp.]
MKKLFVTLICFLALLPLVLKAQDVPDRKAFYSAMASTKESLINTQLHALQKTGGKDRTAFEGALLMRKAGIVSVPAKKLSFFKQGYKKLEEAIAADNNNAEYRFLRLMIQENAPKSLGYNKNIAEDSKIVKAAYKSFPEASRQSVLNFSKKSKALPSSAL